LRGIRGSSALAAPVAARLGLPDPPPETFERDAPLRRLMALVRERDACRNVVIHGMAGVGKTHFAVWAAARLAAAGGDDDRLQLMASLHGRDPARPPADPSAVLVEFLHRLGMRYDQIPDGFDRRIDRYRCLLRERVSFILLDDVLDEESVRPLLPAGGECVAIITSRRVLPGLRDTAHIHLDALSENASLALLRHAAGPERVDADESSARRITAELGRLPLALSIVGTHLREHPDWSLGDYLSCVTALALEGGMRTALSTSDRGLCAEAVRLLRLAALHPGTDLDRRAAAALAGVTPAQATECTEALADANLLCRTAQGGYRLPEMVRAYAAERAGVEEPTSRRRDALDRLLRHYTRTAAAAPGTERDNLLAVAAYAADHGWPELACELANALWRPLYDEGRHMEARQLQQRALGGAALAGDRQRQAQSLLCLSRLDVLSGQYESARGHAESALALWRAAADRPGEAGALRDLGLVLGHQGDIAQALRHLREAAGIARERGDRFAEARTLTAVGTIYALKEDYERAADYHRQALDLAGKLHDHLTEREALHGLGVAYERTGYLCRAFRCQQRALAMARKAGDRAIAGQALDAMGRIHRRAADYQRSLAGHRRALRIAHDIGHTALAVSALNGLSETCRALGHTRMASDYHHRAVEAERLIDAGPGARPGSSELAGLTPFTSNDPQRNVAAGCA
ncbi:tetratricopeptide repeat protein, partial [Allorhizocola rhizosphaerae]|uniref:tetratricopeptide repeat protein n=1 Tax=Allorhizocola rhizosphaerae TaxID=1872709 RepID=UPI000E3DFD6D